MVTTQPMKKLLALLSFAAATAYGAEVKNISLSWDHDGVQVSGFQILSRAATNAPFTLVSTAGATNRTAVVSLTNPPAFLQIAMLATNSWIVSDLSDIVTLGAPSKPGQFKVVTIVTVQVP